MPAERDMIWCYSMHWTGSPVKAHERPYITLQMLEDYGVVYKSYTEQYIDSSGIFKDVIIALLSTLAKQERMRISERVTCRSGQST
jgi:DNA invertase Pin-like site-specific DNA recombinase